MRLQRCKHENVTEVIVTAEDAEAGAVLMMFGLAPGENLQIFRCEDCEEVIEVD